MVQSQLAELLAQAPIDSHLAAFCTEAAGIVAGLNLGREAILTELGRLKGAALLNGFRGTLPVDLDAVVEIVQIVGRLLAEEPEILEIDLNPVVVYPRGEGALALDALMLIDHSKR